MENSSGDDKSDDDVISLEEEKDINMHLLKLMQQHPHLYQKDNKSHSDKIAVDNAWKEVAAQMHEDESAVKTRWTSIKNAYRREAKILTKEQRSGSGASKRTKYFPFYATMKDMLSSSESKRPATSNFTLPNIVNGHSEPGSRSYTTKSFRKKDNYQMLLNKALTSHEERANRIENQFKKAVNARCTADVSVVDKDPNTAFRNLIVAELNKLSPQSAGTKRRKILQVCSEAEE